MRQVTSTSNTARSSVLPISTRQTIKTYAGGVGYGAPASVNFKVPTLLKDVKAEAELLPPKLRNQINSNAGGLGFGASAVPASKAPMQELNSKGSFWAPAVRQAIKTNAGGAGYGAPASVNIKVPTLLKNVKAEAELLPPKLRNQINSNAGGMGFGASAVPASKAPMQELNSKGSLWSPAIRQAIKTNAGGAGYGAPTSEPRFGIVPGGSIPSFGMASTPKVEIVSSKPQETAKFGIVPGGPIPSFGTASSGAKSSNKSKRTDANFKAAVYAYEEELIRMLQGETGQEDKDIIYYRVMQFIDGLEDELSDAQILQELNANKRLILDLSKEDMPFRSSLMAMFAEYRRENNKWKLLLTPTDKYVRKAMHETIDQNYLTDDDKRDIIKYREESIVVKALKSALFEQAIHYLFENIENHPRVQEASIKQEITTNLYTEFGKLQVPKVDDDYQWGLYKNEIKGIAQDIIRQIDNDTYPY